MAERQEALDAQDQLQHEITRAHMLAHKCAQQTADGDLPIVDRETAEHRALLAARTAKELEVLLDEVNEALDA
jgi:hypothetical protein